MKYSIIFAATAAATDAYGAYSAAPSSTPVDTCLTTVYPGYGATPVSITSQHQAYPTCVSEGYGAKSCDKWGQNTYVSTTIKDYDNKEVCVTATNQPVTIYHEKKTITHEAGKYNGYATPTGSYPAPTGAGYNSTGCWYELYEKIETCDYDQLGPYALPGYSGSGLCESEESQKVHVKEYKGGKWTEYDTVYSYGKPTAVVTSYATPGVYTIPSNDVTIDKPYTYCAESTTTAKAGETCTYGGEYMTATKTGYVTGAYGAYETSVYGGKTSTSTVVKYTTIYVSKTGEVELCKPTTTVCEKETSWTYPTAAHYKPGVYHQEAKTVTVTKAGEQYTCPYEQTKTYAMTGYGVYPASSTPAAGYGYPAASSAPAYGSNGYPSYPVKANSSAPAYGNGYASYPTSSAPAYGAYPAVSSVPAYNNGYGEKGYPAAASSTPCDEEEKTYPTASMPAGGYPVPSKPAGGYPGYGEKGYPAAASSTPCEEEEKTYPTASMPAGGYPGYPVSSKPVEYNSYPTPTPAYPANGYPAAASSAPGYGGYPAAASSTPCEEEEKSYPTPSAPAGGYAGYKREALAERRKRAAQ